MKEINQLITQFTGITQAGQNRIFSSIVIIFLLWFLRSVTMKIIWKNIRDTENRYYWQKSSTYVAVLLGLFLIARVWFAGIQSLATFLGLITAGLAIALQDLVKSIAGWIFLLWRRPFLVGDRIQVGEYAGDVIDIRLFKFSLMEIRNWVDADQSTGRVIHLPNSMILEDSIANYTQGFEHIWHEIPVLITFESDWEKAKEILNNIAVNHSAHLSKRAEKEIREASKKFMIFYKNLTPIVYITVKDSGVLLTLRFLIEARKRRGCEQNIWEEILREFAQNDDIDLAYPTQRFYNNVTEGKPGARAEHLEKRTPVK